MDIRITQQPALLGLQITHPKLELETAPATIQRRRGKAELEMRTQPGRLEIDTSPLRESIGLYSPEAFTRMAAEKGMQISLEGIGRRAEEGTKMMNVHKNGFIITKLCEQNAWPTPSQLNTGYMAHPQMNYTPGKVDIHVNETPDQVDVSSPQLDLHLNWGSVNAYLRQQNFIEIEWTGNLLDLVR